MSAWTWAATLLQSSTVAYQYGISGPFWYPAGASIQVLLFGILAIELKRKAPNAHTFLEIIRARYGEAAHRVFLVFALMTNMIVTAMLLLGGAGRGQRADRHGHIAGGLPDTHRGHDIHLGGGTQGDLRRRLHAHDHHLCGDPDVCRDRLFREPRHRGDRRHVREAHRGPPR